MSNMRSVWWSVNLSARLGSVRVDYNFTIKINDYFEVNHRNYKISIILVLEKNNFEIKIIEFLAKSNKTNSRIPFLLQRNPRKFRRLLCHRDMTMTDNIKKKYPELTQIHLPQTMAIMSSGYAQVYCDPVGRRGEGEMSSQPASIRKLLTYWCCDHIINMWTAKIHWKVARYRAYQCSDNSVWSFWQLFVWLQAKHTGHYSTWFQLLLVYSPQWWRWSLI